MATDALRAAALEVVGYRADVIEFIDMEHTAKNLLIRAVRRDRAAVAGERSTAARAGFESLKKKLGIRRLAIEEALLQAVPVAGDE